MFVQLETKFSGIHAEQVFGLHDARERGYIRKDEFCRIMKIFFEGVLDEQGRDLEFLLRLTIMTADQML
jgi:Ca2+-binding EF-hand superfamily protein